ncbi:MAG: double-strand break repair helicase AddA [Sphingomonadales bacterium]|nr:double-strand break repair helicase AddA [Sphingomonadales bacterium]MDE2167976.1 double-strand break repair helicase AddA [Sphingomonadales bacterium]
MSEIHPLAGNQALAVNPVETVWLSASAGTGKTQVLSARVLRLLLEPGVRPEQILCLTFTKAGATEMATRINETLARWVRAEPARLAQELDAIGADIGEETRARARTLFAAVLDCPGGGLRIDTIHAFSQWLLAAFPQEAGLTPGTRPMEEQETVLLSRQVLADLLLDAENGGDEALSHALADLSLRMGGDAALRWLMDCARARDLWMGHGAWMPPLDARVRQLLGLPSNAGPEMVAQLCSDEAFDVRSLRAAMIANQQWKSKTGEANANRIGDWLAADEAGRVARLEDLWSVFFTQKGEARAAASLEKIDPDYPAHVARVGEGIAQVREMATLLALAQWLTPALTLGRAYALAWDEAKAREGLIDFDDQIRSAAALLARSDMADWIRYKMDRRFDHLLVDEAQDTNAAQWRIIDALTEEFFVGLGAKDDRARTLFVVGDYKQAIFGFQGTSPENFEEARGRVRSRMAGAAENAQSLRGGSQAHALRQLGLERSFRTARPVLDFVDRVVAHVGHGAFGLAEAPEPHVGQDRPGLVTLWRPVGHRAEDDSDDEAEEGGETLSRPEREMAERIALQVKHWVESPGGFPLVKGKAPRRAQAGDIMVLVRKRGALASLIVARLHANNVPVAGVDRLRLGAPLAVRDLVAALRFAAQPLDDLNLAALLVSPLMGWTQEQLLEHGYREKGVHLWEHLRASTQPTPRAALERLGELLARAEIQPVQALLHWMLVGPWQGRKALIARLGREASDPIDELVNAANAYASSATPSLVGFLNWFEAGDGELKREAGRPANLVRVMTVHGSKGLQAPIVILADATGNPEAGRGGSVALTDPMSEIGGDEPRRVPMPPLGRNERLGPIALAQSIAAKAEGEEHWRLLYVAMTRSEEALFVGGALGKRDRVPAPASWYARLAELFADEDWQDDPIWGGQASYGTPPGEMVWPPETRSFDMEAALPGWATRTAPDEPVPTKPLAPSALAEDEAVDPPFPPGAGRAMAARRGKLIHALLERLPDVSVNVRQQVATLWLERQAGDLEAPMREEIAQAAMRVVSNPAWADLFAPGALAEVPIAALIETASGPQAIAGTIDRLRVEPDRIRLVDYKTARRPPADLSQVPLASLRQMAAYVAALEVSFPGRRVEAALLYTEAARLIELPAHVIALHKASLGGREQSLGS